MSRVEWMGRGGYDSMMTSSAGLYLTITDPRSSLAHELLYAYYDDVASSYYGRPATRDEVHAAMRDEPSDDLRADGGVFVVATRDGEPAGCGGVRYVASDTGELTRIFVLPAARRTGVGMAIVAFLEAHATAAGLTALRLDTRLDLTDARRLYARLGYADVAPFNSGTYGEVWLAKTLGGQATSSSIRSQAK